MTHITASDDPRLAPFTAMRDRDLRRETGLCLAEGEHLVRRAFEAGLRVRAVLVVEQKADRVEAMLANYLDEQVGWASRPSRITARSDDGRDAHPTEVLTCTKAVLEDAVGFKLHQGIVAAVEPPAAWDGLAGLRRAVQLGEQHGRRALLVCPEITNAENLGLLARVAAGLGAAAMVLGPRCADPWYRRAVRVSMGAVFTLPIVRLDDLDPPSGGGGGGGSGGGLAVLRDELGYTLIATVTDPAATPLDRAPIAPDTKPAILLGSEGYGLPPEITAQCDQQVRIPMHANIDSLNIAVAAGIVLYHYTRVPGE